MSFPLNDLRNLLSKQRGMQSGVVVSAVGGIAKIATRNGLVSARYTGNLVPNDKVLVENGFATLTVTPSQTYSV